MGSRKVSILIAVSIVVISIMLFSSFWYSNYSIRSMKENLSLQVHTRTVILTLKDNFTALVNAETGERGYIITGDSVYLRPYKSSLKTIDSTLKALRFLTRDNAQQQRRLDTFQYYVSKKLEYILEITALKTRGDEATIKQKLQEGTGRLYMDKIRRISHEMSDHEENLFAQRQGATEDSINNAQTIFIVEAVLSLAVIVFLTTIIFNELKRRTKTERRITTYNTELKRKNKEIEQFAYIASHDLQEPLRTVTNFSSLLETRLKDHPDPQMIQFLGSIKNGATRMSTLVSDLLEYSRIGKDTNKVRVDCAKLVAGIISDMSMVIKEKNVEVRVGRLPVLTGYVYLQSLFQNLFTNAIKFSRPGVRPVVTITAKHLDNEYEFAIKDNGIGIEKEYYERIFVIFQRLHTRKEYPGTGIGLAQCKKIVEMHGGKIWVESLPGEGTTFKFTIPK